MVFTYPDDGDAAFIAVAAGHDKSQPPGSLLDTTKCKKYFIAECFPVKLIHMYENNDMILFSH
ncbi:hypothetical protein DX185_17435 [Salmonella enterica]|nr:hypothetical protein [Salmonella enterica]